MDAVNRPRPTPAPKLEPNILKETYKIRSYEVDCRNRLSIPSMFSFMQETAGKHADALGVSIHQLRTENCTWLLSRLKIKITAYPAWKDSIQVRTWPSGTQGLHAMRDFELINNENQIIAAAVSAWLVIDIRKRRPLRIAPFIDRLKPLEGTHSLPDSLDKLPGCEDHTYARNFAVRYQDLDINQHVNNVSFVEWVLESVPAATLNDSNLSELQINFLAEAFQGDQIRAACQPEASSNTAFHHSLSRHRDGRELVRARTVWRNNEKRPEVKIENTENREN